MAKQFPDILTDLEAADWFDFASFSVAHVESEYVLDAIKASLKAFTESGGTFAEWRKELDAMFDAMGVTKLSPWHAETVFRTNLAMAYAGGQVAALDDVKDEFPYWRYSAIQDNRTSEVCTGLNGKVFRNGDYRYIPPTHYSCRSTAIAMSEAEFKRDNHRVTDTLTEDELVPLDAKFLGNKNQQFLDWLEEKELSKRAKKLIDDKRKELFNNIKAA